MERHDSVSTTHGRRSFSASGQPAARSPARYDQLEDEEAQAAIDRLTQRHEDCGPSVGDECKGRTAVNFIRRSQIGGVRASGTFDEGEERMAGVNRNFGDTLVVGSVGTRS